MPPLNKWTSPASFQWCLERKGTFFDCCEVHIAGTMAEGERARKGGGIDAPFSNSMEELGTLSGSQ